MARTKRDDLNDYTAAAKQIELAEVCINVLEAMYGALPLACIKAMKAEQQKALKRLDAYAEKLGAPYPR